MAKPLLPVAIRSPTAVPNIRDINSRIVKLDFTEPGVVVQRPFNDSTSEFSIRRIAARCDPLDVDVEVSFEFSSGRRHRFPLGVLHDAYDGRGVFEEHSIKEAGNVVGTFGSVLAKLDKALDQPRTVEELGQAMQTLTELLSELKHGRASGFPVLWMTSGHQMRVAMPPLQRPAQLFIFAYEKRDLR